MFAPADRGLSGLTSFELCCDGPPTGTPRFAMSVGAWAPSQPGGLVHGSCCCFSLPGPRRDAVVAGAGISGVLSVTDGDTLNIGDQGIRFHGIGAPESA